MKCTFINTAMALIASFFSGLLIKIGAYEFALPLFLLALIISALAIKCMVDDIDI